jgi:hypothetical protein
MSEFELFEQALAEYEKTVEENKVCQHNDIICENGITSCLDCGEEISHIITHEKEWRYYGAADSKRTSDPNRVQIRKVEERNIAKDVESMGFSEIIIAKAD